MRLFVPTVAVAVFVMISGFQASVNHSHLRTCIPLITSKIVCLLMTHIRAAQLRSEQQEYPLKIGKLDRTMVGRWLIMG